MSRPQVRAQFFVYPNGDILLKSPPLKQKQRLLIYQRDDKICQKCGTPVKMGVKYGMFKDEFEPAAIDHIFPISRGGQNDPENLRLLCMSCNAARNNVWSI